MNKKGITLIALIVTVIILMILASVSIVVLMEGNIIERSRQIRAEKRIQESKDTIKSVTLEVLENTDYRHVQELADDIETELKKIKGLEGVSVIQENEDYTVIMPHNIELTFEEIMGKALPLFTKAYITIDEFTGGEYEM